MNNNKQQCPSCGSQQEKIYCCYTCDGWMCIACLFAGAFVEGSEINQCPSCVRLRVSRLTESGRASISNARAREYVPYVNPKR